MKPTPFAYNKKNYYFINGKWISKNGEIQSISMQNELNLEHPNVILVHARDNINTFGDFLTFLDQLESSHSYSIALEFLEKSIIYNLDPGKKRIIFTKMIALHRKNHSPLLAIKTFDRFRNEIKDNVYALTSLGAAYLDMNDYQNAERILNKAYSISKNSSWGVSKELMNTYARLKQ